MLRALLKGSGLFLFGRVPGGARLYREMTRNTMGTQATHVDKLQRVWPGYTEVWQTLCDLKFDGLDIWIHESGWTPFPLLVNYLLTGKAGVVTNSEGRILDKYLSRAVNGALNVKWPEGLAPESRRRIIEPLRWETSTAEALTGVGGRSVEFERSKPVPLESDSVDLCHSGGALEHYRPGQLKLFLSECYRILRPGGIASHVFDNRDHLYHADRKLPFLMHLAWPEWAYEALLGHQLMYHNRLLPTEVTGMFEEAGFEPISIRRMILPQRKYVDTEGALDGQPGISRKWLRSRYGSASDADLRSAAIHYLMRKPRL